MTPVCRISSDRRSYGGRQQFGGASETKSPNGNGRPSRSHAEIFGKAYSISGAYSYGGHEGGVLSGTTLPI